MDQFIDLCILSGCDYCDSIRGIWIFICSIHPVINIILIFFFDKYKYYIDMCILKFWGVKEKKKSITEYPGPVTSFGIFIYPVITG